MAQRNRLTTRQLGLAGVTGVTGVVSFAVAFGAMHFIQPDLDPIESWGSHYAFGRGGWVMRLGFILAGMGTLSLTLGLRKSMAAGKRKGLSTVLMGLVGVGFVGSGLFNADPILEDGTTAYTTEGSLHVLAGMILFISLIVASFVLVGVFARDPRWHPSARTARAFAWSTLIGLVATITASEVTVPGSGGITGLVQRVFVATVLTWLVILGWRVHRLADASVSSSTTESRERPDLTASEERRHFDTVVIGGGQAGLATGYYLTQQNRDFVILDANHRTGDSWRERWDSLRLFTPARFDGLPGMRFPASGSTYIGKNEMADYLEAYAARFELRVQRGVRVDGLSRNGDGFIVSAGDMRFEAANVVVAMGNSQAPWVPSFAADLNPDIVQVHSKKYRNTSQLRNGSVLVVGAGNSGADIAIEVVQSHPTLMAGKESGHIPFRIETFVARNLLVRLVRFVGHRVLTVRTPIGRKLRPKLMRAAAPLVRVKPKDLLAAGVDRVPKVVGVQEGLPVLEDGRVVDVANVIWCTGYRPGFSWIDLPILGDRQEPKHVRGVVPGQPGLYFVGLHFLYSMTSETITGVQRDAKRITKHIVDADRSKRTRPTMVAASTL